MSISEADKRYAKKRAKVCKTHTIKYIPHEMPENNRLEKYLSDNSISFNSYVKQLIKNDLDNKHIPYIDNELSDN